MIACNNEASEFLNEASSSAVYLTSNITPREYADVINKVKNTINHSARATGNELTVDEAKFILKPLANEGLVLQDQLLTRKDELSLSAQDTKIIENLTEDQLAELAFTFYTIYDEASRTQGLKGADIIDCLKQATGINDLGDVLTHSYSDSSPYLIYNGTKMLVSAKTAKQIICALSKRAVGWVGVAWMVYEFGDCIHSKQK